ncbi:LysR family transcriptional regulator [Hyphomicrobium sp.]|uniref:LysR family transcriptional regulator n=1 Tax=Hyphomicrobium sp. TaxID=82 RepID=UPI002FDE444B
MDKLEAMNVLTKVVSGGSFAEAARRLGVTRSAVSKAITQLEQELGARLLDRTTRRVTPTEAGLAYYERCLSIMAQIAETEAQIARLHDEPKGLLKVNAPMSFGTLYLGAAVADFMDRYRELKVELVLTDRMIDPLEEGVDVTVRIGAMIDSSLIARRISAARVLLVASPDYIARHGEPTEPGDLANHKCLHYGHSTTVPRWQLTEQGAPLSVPVSACLSSNNGDTLREAAIKGIGIARLPSFLVGADIAAERLVVVLPEYPPQEITIHALYAPNRFLAAKSRVFIDFLVERFGRPAWERFDTVKVAS